MTRRKNFPGMWFKFGQNFSLGHLYRKIDIIYINFFSLILQPSRSSIVRFPPSRDSLLLFMSRFLLYQSIMWLVREIFSFFMDEKSTICFFCMQSWEFEQHCDFFPLEDVWQISNGQISIHALCSVYFLEACRIFLLNLKSKRVSNIFVYKIYFPLL